MYKYILYIHILTWRHEVESPLQGSIISSSKEFQTGIHSGELFELLVAAYLTYESAITMWKKWNYPGKDVDEEFTDAILGRSND